MKKKNERYLITSADESTWKFDRPVIFLGEWCRIYNRKHIWKDMDAIVAEPYGLGQSQKNLDDSEARAIEDKLFDSLYLLLNEYHDEKYSKRFWRIVLGHWIGRYVNLMLNRIKTLQQCLSKYQISGMTVYSNTDFYLITQNSSLLDWASSDDRWNNILNDCILNLLKEEKIAIETIKTNESSDIVFKSSRIQLSLKRDFLKWIYKHLGLLLSFFSGNNDAFIINSYLPLKEEVKLHFALGQLPQLWTEAEYNTIEKPNQILRKNLATKFKIKSSDNHLEIMSTMLFELLPICFLEDFSNLKKSTKKQPWPKNPKFIFTSNNFDTDEIFKLWTATKVDSGSKYFVGQHGNNFGTKQNMIGVVEELTCDKYITWGWKDGLVQHNPAFIFKTVGLTRKNYNPDGGLLLIELHLNHRINTWDETSEFDNYFREQQVFVDSLNNLPKEHLNIRLHPTFRKLSWHEEFRWKDFDQSLKLDTSDTNIFHLISRSRLVIHSYDSTGILETLSQNIPTLAFWQNDLEHLRDSAKPFYQLLVDAEIIHFTPESIAHKINEIWDDIDGWWMQKNVQDLRRQFCNRYAKESQNPIHELKTILLE